MNRKSVASLITAGLLMAGSQFALASNDVAAVNNQKYAKECGSCHMAYQPGLLPERSWRKLMDGLNDHFGENAEVADADRQELTDYLAKNAADHVNYKRSVRMNQSISRNETPLQITKVSYFAKEHREVGNRIKGSDKIKSLGQCELCHQKANDGSYAEGEINVPGIGRWED